MKLYILLLTAFLSFSTHLYSNDSNIKIEHLKHDKDMFQAIKKAKTTVNKFIQLCEEKGEGNYPAIKYTIVDNGRTHMWLLIKEINKDYFEAELFETPPYFNKYKVGDSFNIKFDEIMDWMIIVDGTLHGGYTTRVIRNKLSEKKKIEMDEYMGIERYAN